MLEERVIEMNTGYRAQFAERGGVTPTDPLEYHLYHLTLYWSRLIGFCRQDPANPDNWIEGDLGACVQVATDFASELIKKDHSAYESWMRYHKQVFRILYERPVSLGEVEGASNSYDHFLRDFGYDAWAKIRT